MSSSPYLIEFKNGKLSSVPANHVSVILVPQQIQPDSLCNRSLPDTYWAPVPLRPFLSWVMAKSTYKIR